ncbi:Membrane-bound lytic murein transglycosylase A precursor [compost metagenome]
MRSLFLVFSLIVSLALPASAQDPARIPLADDGEVAALQQAVSRTRAYLAGSSRATIPLGDRQIPRTWALKSAERFSELLAQHGLSSAFYEAVQTEFDWISVPGSDGQGKVHATGYYLPLLEARAKPDSRFRFPLYGVPKDLVRVNLGAFHSRFEGEAIVARLEGGKVLPYFSRSEIDDGGVLSGKGLELAWVDDEMARYSLMVQGSGLLRFEDGRIANVNYAAANGHAYKSLGKALIADGKIPAERISMPAIEAYFRERPAEMRPYLNRNPSYVFFKLAPEGPYGTDGIALVPGRAIATDKRLFGSGLIGYLTYPRARFAPSGAVASWEAGSRFVLDQDTGGAIKGPGRVDVYWGGGSEAALRAGTLNGDARLWYLLLKETPRP